MTASRSDSTLVEKAAAIKVALASTDLSDDPWRTLSIIEWVLGDEEFNVSRPNVPTRLFIAGIKATEKSNREPTEGTQHE